MNPSAHTATRLEHVAAHLQVWLGGVIAFVAALSGAALAQLSRPLLRLAEQRLKRLIFARAAQSMDPIAPVRGPRRPANAPIGFRRAPRACSARRLVTRNVLPTLRRFSVRDRVARIVHVVRHLDVYVTRLRRRLRAGFVASRLIAVAPPTCAVISAPTPRVATADTS